ncbi:MAG: hypothetical protein GTO29_08625 [Candidatus Latescibacteria bacterium]|nr:hypothetical protein [Candidatus Latescibacterota bacterium]NIO56228.1 hypothetical protein [Candidatus Latescibacterota bacterium]
MFNEALSLIYKQVAEAQPNPDPEFPVHENCKNSDCCYRLWQERPICPMVKTSRTLSEKERKPFRRIFNDAYRYAFKKKGKYTDHSEDLKKMLSGTKFSEFLEKKSMQEERQVFDYGDLMLKKQTSEAISKRFGSAAIKKPSGEGEGKGGQGKSEKPPLKRQHAIKDIPRKRLQVGKAGVKALGSVGGIAIEQMLEKGSAATQALVMGLPSRMAGAGIGLTMGLTAGFIENLNTRREFKTFLEPELEKSTGSMDIDKVMTALRTILKDGGYFEVIVNSVGTMKNNQLAIKNIIKKKGLKTAMKRFCLLCLLRKL